MQISMMLLTMLRVLFWIVIFFSPIFAIQQYMAAISWYSLVFSIIMSMFSVKNCITLTTWSVLPKNPDHIYTAWYIFFLTSCASFLIFWYLYQGGHLLIDGGGWRILSDKNQPVSEQLFSAYFQTATDIRDEFHAIVVLLFLVVVPQCLSVFVSGLFGCARSPVWISKSMTIILLMIVKFFYGIGGIELASSLIMSFVSLEHTTYSRMSLVLIHLVSSVWFMSSGLLIAAVYFRFDDLCRAAVTRLGIFGLARVWARMTRFSSAPERH
jgi:hypothetical protein